ncbi:primase-helicase family protein [uncultured Sunxiuqinia sp.]|uniref:primase-helicase family protein n=1 Tax=Sunxiuqinia rutila TaxID=1397841 RepID=UPI002634D346|nr:primase-helicase family protein [uncultured Sunxiuqinia sp.]
MVNTEHFKLEHFFIKSEYYVYRLSSNGRNTFALLDEVSPLTLIKVYNIPKENFHQIPVYAGFTIEPDNTPNTYNRSIDLGDGVRNFNLYDLPSHPEGQHTVTDNKSTNWPTILKFLKHIAPYSKPFPFSKHTYTELILEYLAIAWKYPKQRLPILVLLSKERSTGKTTFLRLIELMFQNNAQLVSSSDLESQFNLTWGTKNFVLVDEACINKRLQVAIRNEATSSSRIINAKFKNHLSVPNYTKFVMASNEIADFAEVDIEENRYFVLEVAPLAPNSEDPFLLDKIEAELPNFLDYLMNHHQFFWNNSTRFWFPYEAYKTPALNKIVKGERYFEVMDITTTTFLGLLNDLWFSYSNDNDIQFAISPARDYLGLDRTDEFVLKQVLKDLGFHCTNNKTRFNCAFAKKQIHSRQYSCSLGNLRKKLNWKPKKQIC